MKDFSKTYIIGGKRQKELCEKGYSIKTFNFNDNPQEWAIEMTNKGYKVILGKSTTSIKGYHNYVGFYK